MRQGLTDSSISRIRKSAQYEDDMEEADNPQEDQSAPKEQLSRRQIKQKVQTNLVTMAMTAFYIAQDEGYSDLEMQMLEREAQRLEAFFGFVPGSFMRS